MMALSKVENGSDWSFPRQASLKLRLENKVGHEVTRGQASSLTAALIQQIQLLLDWRYASLRVRIKSGMTAKGLSTGSSN